MSVSNLDKARKVNVLLIGESPRLFSFCRSPLEKAGCQCYFAESHQEMSKVVRHTKVDIVFSLNAQQNLSELMAQLAGSCVTMSHRLPVEEGGWWLPVLRYGENCLGTAAFRPGEFTGVFAEFVKSIVTDAAFEPALNDLNSIRTV
jgi:hypothetical protein